jgi:nickel-dependent lactate racemase
LGPEIAATYRVVNHDASAGEDHRWLGSTSKGTPVYIDERFMAVNLHISLALSSSI